MEASVNGGIMGNKHTIQELKQWQALPLSIKVLMTQERIRNWVREYDYSRQSGLIMVSGKLVV